MRNKQKHILEKDLKADMGVIEMIAIGPKPESHEKRKC